MSHDANTVVPSILQPLQTDEYVALSRTELCGYPKLTPEAKRKILAGNAARLYGIDLDHSRWRLLPTTSAGPTR